MNILIITDQKTGKRWGEELAELLSVLPSRQAECPFHRRLWQVTLILSWRWHGHCAGSGGGSRGGQTPGPVGRLREINSEREMTYLGSAVGVHMYLVAQRKSEKFGRLSIKNGCLFTTGMAAFTSFRPSETNQWHKNIPLNVIFSIKIINNKNMFNKLLIPCSKKN
jgi:hypothetical protein